MKNKLWLIALVAVIGFSFAACSDGSGNDPNPQKKKLPEDMPVKDRWWSWVDPTSTAKVNYSVDGNGVCTITVTGKAESHNETDGWYAWKAFVAYSYTEKAGKSYEYTFEAWTESSVRELHIEYFENNNTQVYLSETIPITSTRQTYTVYGEPLPKLGEYPALRFQCADQLGKFYVKILGIEEVIPGGMSEGSLEKIAVTTHPTKTQYNLGEDLNTAGMVVTATYSNGATAAVTGYTVSGYDKTVAGNHTITVTWQGKTATFMVNVVDPGKATAATPTANPQAGAVASGTMVALASATDGAEIWYTTNGSTPVKGGAGSTKYTSPITISAAVTIKAIAVKDDMNDSGVLEAAYTIILVDPDTYIVQYNKNADAVTGTMADSVHACGAEHALTLNSYAATGYTFLGWNSEPDGSGTSYANGAIVQDLAADGTIIILYAQWQITAATAITLNKDTLSLKRGTSETLIATVKPDNAADKTVTWSSSNASVASVVNGTVSTHKIGTATITVAAADGAITAECVVSVLHPLDIWTTVAVGTFQNYYAIQSVAFGNNTFVAAGENGKIARSTDNGATWNAVTTNNVFGTYANGINSVAFGNNTFVAVGESGKIARSTDNGATWTAVANSTFSNDNIKGITFGNNTFAAVSFGRRMARSTDNGETWTAVADSTFNDANNWITSVVFGGNTFVAVGGNGKIARSTDNGVTWTAVTTNAFYFDYLNHNINCIAFGGNTFVAGGTPRYYSGLMAYSTDNGVTWTTVADANNPFGYYGTEPIYCIAFGNNTFVAGGGIYGTIAYSTDNGETWTAIANNQFSNRSISINSIAYGNNTFVAGIGGTIAYSSDN